MLFKADYGKNPTCFVQYSLSQPLENKYSDQHNFPNSSCDEWIQSPETVDAFSSGRLMLSTAPLQNEEFSVLFHHFCLCKEEPLLLLELQQWARSLHLLQIIQKRVKKLPPENVRSSENVHRTKAFVKCELLAAHQNTLRNTVGGSKQIEFYWLWGPRRLRNWFYEISVKLYHWFLACLWAKNTLLTRKHANPSSQPGSKPQPVLLSASRVFDGRLLFSVLFYLVLKNLAQFFQKQTKAPKANKQKTLKNRIVMLYFLYPAIQKCCN